MKQKKRGFTYILIIIIIISNILPDKMVTAAQNTVEMILVQLSTLIMEINIMNM